MARGKRKRVGEGVYTDDSGLSATVKVHGKQKEQRFPVGTSLTFIAAWRQRTRDDLLDETPVEPSGSFAQDLERYLRRAVSRPGFKADRAHLRAWLPQIGPLERRRVRSTHVTVALQAWTAANVSPRTIRHRLRVLKALWVALDGPHAPHPTLGVPLPRVPAPHPVAVSWSMVQRVAKSLARGARGKKAHGPLKTIAPVKYPEPKKTRARFLVLATTGQRPTQVMRAVRTDVDLKRRIWFVRAAKGGTGIALPLSDPMILAWQAFIAADAWGTYDTRSFVALLRRHGWPKGIRPYALRHTLAIDLLLGGADLGDVQAALGHRQIETTRRHYAAMQLSRQRKVMGQLKRGGLA